MSTITSQQRLENTTQFMKDYKIQKAYLSTIDQLKEYEIVVIADDSGSMDLPFERGKVQTRWEYLKSIIGMVIKAATIFDSNGFDLYFLNRGACLNVADSDKLKKFFVLGPSGGTPLLGMLNTVFTEYARKSSSGLIDKKLLVIVCTDGEPSDQIDFLKTPDIRSLIESTFKVNKSFCDKVALNFVMCTTDEIILRYYDEQIDPLKSEESELDLKIDLISEYSREKVRVEETNITSKFTYTEGVHNLRTIMSAVDRTLDKMDQSAVGLTQDHVVKTEDVCLDEEARLAGVSPGCGCIIM